ncbi:phospholipase D-like domain-containing protein, partial [Georgenia sp. 10Sc9-8]|nr:phospholipase D-like domain-containing protein [Georgenia halotolerans]
VTTYTYGEALFRDMLAAIRSAERTVYFETFIWKDDEWGQVIKDALVDAARRGVQVHVVYDGFANVVVPRSFFRFPELATLHVFRFPVFRPGLLTLNPRRTGREHRKLLVVDGMTGFMGGFNVGSVYQSTWRDTHVRLQGPEAWELEKACTAFWNDHRGRQDPTAPADAAKVWEPRIRAAQNAPDRLQFPVRDLYMDAIDRARSHIYLTQGYFIPDRVILDSILAAARRGTEVRILLPESSNHVVADWIARSYWSDLLGAGVRLFLFRGAMVHAKTATADGRWTTVGTANIDRMSLMGNFEINLVLLDDELAATMEDLFELDMTNARELTLEEWDGRGRLARAGEQALRPLRLLL